MQYGTLVLSRRNQEVVVMKDTETGMTMRITICSISSNQVVLSFHAPKSISVDRLEVFNKKLDK